MGEKAASSRTPETPNKPLVTRLLRLAAFVVIPCVVIFILLEIVTRVFDPLGVSFYPEMARQFDTMIREEPIGYRLPPELHGHFHGVTVETNSLGLRDREIPPQRARGEFRILFLGDSMAFGMGVEYEDSIPHVLEIMLNENSAPDRRYRTVNMGVTGYNTEQELIQLKTLGMKLNPNLVIVLFSQNDIFQKMWSFTKRASWWANLGQRSYAVSLLFRLAKRVRSKLFGAPITGSLDRYRADHPRWLAIDRSMAEMNRLCQSAGIPFIVFYREPIQAKTSNLLTSLGKREDFAVLPLKPFEDPRWNGKDPQMYKMSAVDHYPNKEGSRMWATVIYEQLVKQGVLE